jgi:hypothetical protein
MRQELITEIARVKSNGESEQLPAPRTDGVYNYR